MGWAKYQLELFYLSLSFFSRIPIPASTPYSSERMNRAGRYFALVGILIGSLCGVVFALSATLFPVEVAVFITMAFSLMLTGAFHEDGLTDMADGIGGGMTLEKRLTIMKDSRIGTYGAATLIMALLGKFLLLSTLAQHFLKHSHLDYRIALGGVLVLAYTLSRSLAASLIYDMDYVNDTDTSKSKPLANAQTTAELAFLLVCGFVVSMVIAPNLTSILVICLAVLRFAFKRWLKARIGGFTGDCLGAAQQLSELAVYLILVSVVHLGGTI